ncbi:hypothetical protein BV20DRAFT_713880 [Pilatotrama ljubarskyi]|nr:hypothetical protein BV20DRAFT_713880 [Pilatotrama ljubarskyi]
MSEEHERVDDQQDTKTTDPQLDWQALRAQSIRPHGFREERVRIWPKLLHVDDRIAEEHSVATPLTETTPSFRTEEESHEDRQTDDEKPHTDERQIALDTDRSFVLYPVEETASREKLQAGLNRLIVSVFRRRPRLHYFQGYHDIVSVLFLTLPKGLHIPVTEKMSLHRVRDSMGTTLEPVVGLLRILKRLLHLADEKFAAILERAAPLPYYALSNLLTLFSHDVPTLPLIQHVFDYLLSRPPIAVVYLAAALTLTRRKEVQVLEDEGEDGMMHSLLTGLPELYEEDEPSSPKEECPVDAASASEEKPMAELKTEEADTPISPYAALAASDEPASAGDYQSSNVDESREEPSKPYIVRTDEAASEDRAQDEVETRPAKDDLDSLPGQDPPSAPTVQPPASVKTEANDASLPRPSMPKPEPSEPVLSEKAPSTRPQSPEPSDPDRPPRPRVSLTSLLKHADELYEQYPPTHPGIDVQSIMGPQSVMRTWSERPSELPDDDEAELMVTKPELIVLPYIEPEDDDIASDGESSFRHSPREKGRRKKAEREKEKRRRKLRKPRRLTDIVVQRKTMVAGAVLVLGVAMAVYGFNAGLPGTGGGHHRSGFGREWRKMGRFLGGALVGAGEKVFQGIRRGLE